MLETRPWSTGSYGHDGKFYARIESIDDPLRRNRVQVRVFGYQDDTGTIPKDKLQWVHVRMQDSQIQGASCTHNYYPGAQVMVENLGTELIVTGAVAGFDSDDRNSNSASKGQEKQPDTPRAVQGEGKKTGTASDGEGKDVVQLKRDPKTKEYLQKPDEKKTYNYSKENAPFEKGDAAKFPDLKSVGIDKLSKGSELISVIRSMDGNLSGAIKPALDIIKNLRQNGFGTSKNVIGPAPLQAANQAFVERFGAGPTLDLAAIVLELALCAKMIRDATPAEYKAMSLDGRLTRIISSVRPIKFNVEQLLIDSLYGQSEAIRVSVTPATYAPFLIGFKNDFATCVQRAVSGIVNTLNELSASLGGPGSLVELFGDPANLITLAVNLAALAQNIGIGAASLHSAGGGVIGVALLEGINGLLKLRGRVSTSPASPSNAGSGGGGGSGKMAALLNMFGGNPVAMSEIMSGKMNPESLLKIPLKYAQKQQNQPKKLFPG